MEGAVRKTFVVAVLAAAGVLWASASAMAHHGQASYEPDKVITLTGIVTEWVWANPHCYLKLDVKDSGGAVAHWVIETQNPVSMSKGGWSRRSFAPGDEVTVTLQPVKSGAPLGLVRSVVLANGQTLGASGDAPRTR
jgi:hypothetical protein